MYIWWAVALAVPLCGCSRPYSLERRMARPDPLAETKYSFSRPPYIHPKIIQDLATWISDSGDQVVAVNLLESQGSNRYFADVKTRKLPGRHDLVYVEEEEKTAGVVERSSFSYEYVGKTSSGIHVLRTSDWGGGSGVFVNLMLVELVADRALECDWEKLTISPGRRRLLVRKLAEIGLGDRWSGKLKVEGEKIFVGKDEGWFSKSGGKGGGWLSYDRKDRVLTLESCGGAGK
jgi:hypothetical protein